ncbi:PHD finger protein MALE STERILITY like [Actinidia chinensis var. chinensis]|uniref:PHD finger protein MALE STERILITY like n=1 Tax=Actinidia chinensis var. chinensis TaxID=1590841 RepID=A0A2R6RE44_ACTCC|nr:PHD finger protein MALE STERILITY like [Actinidia chinensis var. chinensis]
MSGLDLSGCKKRKRGERVFKFRNFGERGHPVDWNGGFWQNVKGLLEFGQLESDLCCGRASWSFHLEVHRHPPVHVSLVVVEEPVEVHRHCKYCQYVGWGHHMICNKKYHFLVPSKGTAVACLNHQGNCERVKSTKGKSNLVELKAHIMHGVFHSNGFGHLLSVNGLELGSDLPGYQIMDFWDRLCTGLRARKVSLNDISQKKSMDLRLIHGLAYGEPWFGRWGYRFGRGSYGVTQPMYQKAIETIQSMPLCLLVHHFSSSSQEISTVISRYQTLSGHSLATLGDLFYFILELKSRLPKEHSIESYNLGIFVESTCRWSPKRVEMATRVIVEALKRAEFRWVSRQEVRDAARAYIGDTGLLDFVLKSLGNHIVGNYLVRRSLNPVTKVLEYCLEDIPNAFLNQEGLSISDSKTRAQCIITRVQLMKDMFYLYKHILKEQKPTMVTGVFSTIQVASRIILDTKYLIKEYYGDPPLRQEAGIALESRINCTIVLMNDNQVDERLKRVMVPYECFKLNSNATFDELKLQVEKSFREIYWGLRSFVAQSTLNLNAKGSDFVFRLVEVGGKVIFEGTNFGVRGAINEDIFEGVQPKFLVDCSCGTKDDDDERMVSCDICEVWQHTRCVRIPNDQEIPTIFLCNRCEQDIILFSCLP